MSMACESLSKAILESGLSQPSNSRKSSVVALTILFQGAVLLMSRANGGPLYGRNRNVPAVVNKSSVTPGRSSASAHAIQEEFDGSLSPQLLGFWTGRDAVELLSLGSAQHKAEDQIGRDCGVLYLDLAAGRKLLKQDCDCPNPTQPTLFICQL